MRSVIARRRCERRRRRGFSGAVPRRRRKAAAPRELPQRLCEFFHLCLRALAGSSAFLLPDPDGLFYTRPFDLPPGHPERLIPHVPPSAEERLLWAQFAAGPVRR